MNTLDPSERDELVSAYLDGEATADERALVEASPELMARVETLRSIAAMVAAPIVVDPALRERHIEAALAASATSAKVTSLEPRRRRLDRTWALSAAAVLLAVIIAIPVFRSGDGDDDTAAVSTDDTAEDSALQATDAGDDSASAAEVVPGDDDADGDTAALAAEEGAQDTGGDADSADEATDDAMEDAATAADDAGDADDGGADADDAEADAAPEPPGTEIGPVADVDEFVTEITRLIDSGEAAERAAPLDDTLDCGDALAELVGDGTPQFSGRGTIDEQAVEYTTFANQNGTAVLVAIVEAGGCAFLDLVELPAS